MKWIGTILELYRYPIKSMAYEALTAAALDWYGVAGDRRLALRRVGDISGFPWLTAGRWPRLLHYRPFGSDAELPDSLPTHVRTPEGCAYGIYEAALAEDIERAYGARVEMFRLKQGVFDEAPVSVLAFETAQAIAAASDTQCDVRRFRPNILVKTDSGEAFVEDGWVGGTIVFGEREDAPRIAVTMCDKRCSMVNLDPETGASDARVLKTVVRLNETNAGIYGTVIRTGRIEVGMKVFLA